MLNRTWDGQPVASEPPWGASVIVYRHRSSGLEVLLLHRAHEGPSYEGSWAWGPPAGARLPGEPAHVCARRELEEETGLQLTVEPTTLGTDDWFVYIAEASPDATVALSDEHDRMEWVVPAVAAVRSLPSSVADPFSHLERLLAR